VGLALKTSWQQSQADIVGYMDLDLATDLTHFLQAYNALNSEGFDLVYATRLHRKSRVIGRTVKREITSRVFNTILRVYLGVRFSDGMCGFKWLKREKTGCADGGWCCEQRLVLQYRTAHGGRMAGTPDVANCRLSGGYDTTSSRVNITRLAVQYLKAMKVLERRRHG
jgi:hypothetical protein